MTWRNKNTAPKNGDEFIATILFGNGDKKVRTVFYSGEGFICSNCDVDYKNVIAWQPLPKPFKQE